MSQLALLGGSRSVRAPFPVWPEWGEREVQAVSGVVASGKWWMYDYASGELQAGGGGDAERSCVERFERAFAERHGVRHALAVNSGSNALDVSMRALELSPGDEVITTPYTFFATSSCILNAGAWPVYVDIDRSTYNIDARGIEAAITPQTRAILPVHFAGDLADVDAICRTACERGLTVVEDAAQAHGVSLRDGRRAGSFGLGGIFSFQASKCVSGGEGGLIVTNDDTFAERCWSLRHCGRRPGGLWYEHVRVGWNHRMAELPAALLLAQLERLEDQNRRRMENVAYFHRGLKQIGGLVPTNPHPESLTRNHYLVMLRYDPAQWDGLHRDRFVEALSAEGVPTSTGYAFLNFENPVFRDLKSPVNYAEFAERCPNAVRACRSEAVWLMHHLFLGDHSHVDAILAAIVKVREHLGELTAADAKRSARG